MAESHGIAHFLRKHWRNTVYSNVWISVCAACAIFQTELLLYGEMTPVLGVFAFFSTVCIYNYQRVIKLNKPSYVIPGRNTWLVKNRGWILLWTIIGAIASLVCLLFLNLSDILILALPGLISVVYVLNFFKLKKRRVALRDLPFVKIYAITFTWVVLTVLLPYSHHGMEETELLAVAWLCLERFLFILAITIPFDVRDLKYDDVSQKTLPQLLGEKGAKVFSIILIVLSFGVTSMLYSLELIYGAFSYAALAIGALVTVTILYRVNQGKKELFFTGTIDGLIAAQFVLVAGSMVLERLI